MGNMFMRLPIRQSRAMLAKDQVQLDLTVNLLRSSLKDKVNSLREEQLNMKLKSLLTYLLYGTLSPNLLISGAERMQILAKWRIY